MITNQCAHLFANQIPKPITNYAKEEDEDSLISNLTNETNESNEINTKQNESTNNINNRIRQKQTKLNKEIMVTVYQSLKC